MDEPKRPIFESDEGLDEDNTSFNFSMDKKHFTPDEIESMEEAKLYVDRARRLELDLDYVTGQPRDPGEIKNITLEESRFEYNS